MDGNGNTQKSESIQQRQPQKSTIAIPTSSITDIAHENDAVILAAHSKQLGSLWVSSKLNLMEEGCGFRIYCS
jgi:hypothetical protein